jgi:hypothetical protein
MNSREPFYYDRTVKSEVIAMVYRNLMTLTAALTLPVGIFFYNRGYMIVPYLGDGILPAPPQRSLTIWSAISFTRLFGSMLITVGLIAWAVRKLDRPDDQRRIGLAFFIGSLSLSFIALIQQIALWRTTPGWIAICIIAVFPLSFGYMLFVEFGLTDSRPLALTQNPDKLRASGGFRHRQYVVAEIEYFQKRPRAASHSIRQSG